jgi:hypothetical protein
MTVKDPFRWYQAARAAAVLPDPDRTTVRPVWGPGRPWKPVTILTKGKPWNRCCNR